MVSGWAVGGLHPVYCGCYGPTSDLSFVPKDQARLSLRREKKGASSAVRHDAPTRSCIVEELGRARHWASGSPRIRTAHSSSDRASHDRRSNHWCPQRSPFAHRCLDGNRNGHLRRREWFHAGGKRRSLQSDYQYLADQLQQGCSRRPFGTRRGMDRQRDDCLWWIGTDEPLVKHRRPFQPHHKHMDLNHHGRYAERTQSPGPVLAGTGMIEWGGATATFDTNTGARYNPSTNTWTTISTVKAPSARNVTAAVWTGSKMLIWGGQTYSGV